MAVAHSEVWQRGTVAAARDLTPEIRRVEIDVDSPVRVEPGAHLDLRLPIAGKVERRSYSIVDATSDGARVALSVYTSPVSRGGAAVMNALRPRDRVEMTQPLNDFPLRLGARRYVLLAGGIGITALAGMAERLRTVGADYRMLYLGRSRSLMAYLDDLRERHGDRLRVHVRDEGTSISVPQLVASIEPGTEMYVCGPIRLMDAVRRAWIEAGLPPADLRTETFGNSGWHDPQPFTVRIPSLGLETVVPPNQSMLEALEAAGADLLYDCRKGECGLCEVRVAALDGDIDHRDVFYSERQRDASTRMCCCVSRVVAPTGGTTGVVTILPT
ncbi:MULTISPECIES: PDR/VanB family oxidoreductase [Microbacterium]|jgi:ferredoxin-NADP reductase|uniref:PDR/VanB family oxidoreductase n=1 Tax=Microbacterium TaxID=33882 RepID=UPI001D173F06|nr:PDR/VanB family oxidoreductase [Microbacterium testaceum]MCC4250274.1 PDR/VanB family oxidoreductase [Microbacterium testaceum]